MSVNFIEQRNVLHQKKFFNKKVCFALSVFNSIYIDKLRIMKCTTFNYQVLKFHELSIFFSLKYKNIKYKPALNHA